MKWKDIQDLSGRLAPLLPQDGFSENLLAGALMAARQKNNPVRGNLFSAALRELITHTLHTMAPDQNVEKCSWYSQEPNTRGPTRRQRTTYIIQGGLSDQFIQRELGLDPKREHKRLADAMTELNKRTHMRSHSAIHKSLEVRKLVGSSLQAFLAVFAVAAQCRKRIEDALIDTLDQAIMDELIGNTIDELDELSTHTRVDEHSIDDVTVADINETTVTYSISGTVDVELQYGSDSDIHNDIGLISSDSFPYSATITASVRTPKSLNTPEVVIDNSSFFE